MKRSTDIVLALFALLGFAPLMLLIALAIVIEDGRPVLFRQERMGRGRLPFRLYKFRTLKAGKVLKVGHWLRQTGLDEVPQFLNVLLGEMSIVGPRPLTREDIERLGWQGEAQALRWSVRPGITGTAQLFGRGRGKRVNGWLDRRYIRTRSLALDLQLIALSFAVNLFGKRRVLRWWRTADGILQPRPSLHRGTRWQARSTAGRG